MAGPVRQPIDVAALERYIDQNVPDIKTPIDVKQVIPRIGLRSIGARANNLFPAIVVWLRTEQSHIPADGLNGEGICHAKETSRSIALENGA